MIARGIRIFLVAVLLAAVLAVAAAAALAGWVLHTPSGTAWAFERLRAAIPGELASTRIEGTFAGGLRMTGLRYAGPGVEVSAARLELAIDPDFFPPALTVAMLDAGDVHVALRPAPPAPEPERPFSPESLALPFELLVTDLEVEGFRLSGAGGDELLALERVALAGRWHESISLSRLDVESPLGAVRGSASLSLARPFPADATLELRHALALGDDSVPLTVNAWATGDLARLDLRLDSAEPAVTVEGRLEDVLEAPAWALEARSPTLSWPLSGAEPVITVGELALRSRGSASGYSLAAEGTLTALADAAVGFALAATGNTRGIDVERLELSGEPVAADAQGALRWADGFGVELDARVARLDPAAFTAHWPAGMPVAGHAAFEFRPGKVELQTLEAAVPGTDRRLAARGVIDLDSRVVDLDLDWRDLQWPLAGDDWRVQSRAGEVVVAGSPDAWTLAGRVALVTPGLPPGAFVLSGEGSREEATLVIQDSEVLGGRVAGRVHYALPNGGRWVANLSARGIDTAGLLPDWPGRIDAELATSGRVEPLELTVDIDRLSGSLRGRPLTGSGGIRFAGGNLAVQDLALASGEAELRADGSLRGSQGLEFELDVPALAAVVPGAAGALEAQGTLNFSQAFPRADLSVAGRGLAWRGWRVEALRLTATEGDAPLTVALDAETLTLAGLELERLETELDASETRQRLAASATLGGRELALVLDGRFADWQRPLDSGWSGRLEALTAELTPDLTLALEEPAAVTLGPERVALERACLAEPAGPARVCAAASHAAPNDYELAAELTAIPVGLAKLAFDTELEFTQTLDGSLGLRAVPGRRLSADARIDIAPGRIYHPANRRMNLDTRAGVFRLDLDEGRVLLAELSLPVGTATAIDARFGLTDVQRGQASPIEGRVAVDVGDIGVLTALVPSLPRADGRLAVDLAIAGTLDAPAVTGDASLTDGALTFAPLGLELEDIQLESRIREGNRIDLTSTFRAGEGTGRLSSSTNGLGEEDLRLRLTGDQLTVVNLPQLNVVADMNVGVGVSARELTLNGWISIPHARIAPRELAPGRISESEDVVIVASESGEEEAAAEPATPLSLRGRVGLTLGDDVLVDFDAAETRLTGAVAFDWNGPPMPTATGEYKVSGRFEAYGQLLEITEGSVRFPGVPANNPQLRIRAEREIFGNPQIRTAGVLVTGSARDPELEVYTNPETTEERALTLLVTGSDFDYEQGVGAVDLGTYIAPDLYLSYGIGLFDRENVISLRYDIARGFGIKATSGKSTEGIDLSYTFER